MIAALIATRGHATWLATVPADEWPLLLTAATLVATTVGIVMANQSSTKQLEATTALREVMIPVVAALGNNGKLTESTTGISIAAKKVLYEIVMHFIDTVVDVAQSTESTRGLHEVMKELNVDADTARRHLRAASPEQDFAALLMCSLLSVAVTCLPPVPSASKR